MPLQATIIRQNRLTASERETMFALHTRFFENVRREKFYSDLAEKDWVIRIHSGDTLAGFSTQQLLTLDQPDRPQRFLFSGDTIVDPAFWREQALAGSFGHLMLHLMELYGEEDLFWFLISKGFRTYRFLPVFFHRFIPAPEQQPDPRSQELLHAIAHAKFGRAYDADHGLIRFGGAADHLCPEMAVVPASRQNDPFVACFLQHNPDHHRGDELACLAEIRRDNLNRFAWRVIEHTHPTWLT